MFFDVLADRRLVGRYKVFEDGEGHPRFLRCLHHACEKRSKFSKSLQEAFTNPEPLGMNWESNAWAGVY